MQAYVKGNLTGQCWKSDYDAGNAVILTALNDFRL